MRRFIDLFKGKTEEAMQRRAERSRETKELTDKFNETIINLEHDLTDLEIRKKKKKGG